jgi:hypothetical protein
MYPLPRFGPHEPELFVLSTCRVALRPGLGTCSAIVVSFLTNNDFVAQQTSTYFNPVVGVHGCMGTNINNQQRQKLPNTAKLQLTNIIFLFDHHQHNLPAAGPTLQHQLKHVNYGM